MNRSNMRGIEKGIVRLEWNEFCNDVVVPSRQLRSFSEAQFVYVEGH
jgi:hypothetical protein